MIKLPVSIRIIIIDVFAKRQIAFIEAGCGMSSQYLNATGILPVKK
jgi:hypothetical protein